MTEIFRQHLCKLHYTIRELGTVVRKDYYKMCTPFSLIMRSWKFSFYLEIVQL